MQQTILAISGKPGLYKLVSRGNNNLIVEALDATHKRMPAFATDRITSLADVAMFTETDDIPLMDVLDNLKKLEGGKKASINEKKASSEELRAYFTKVLPEWDQDRVQNSHIKKLISWYNILVEAGIQIRNKQKRARKCNLRALTVSGQLLTVELHIARIRDLFPLARHHADRRTAVVKHLQRI